MTFTAEQIAELQARAAILANLEGIGDGSMQVTLAELQSIGSEMLAIIEGDA